MPKASKEQHINYSKDTHVRLFNTVGNLLKTWIDLESINYARLETLFKICIKNPTFDIAKSGTIFRNLLVLISNEKAEKLGIDFNSPDYNKAFELFELYLGNHPLNEQEFETIFKNFHSLIVLGFTDKEF